MLRKLGASYLFAGWDGEAQAGPNGAELSPGRDPLGYFYLDLCRNCLYHVLSTLWGQQELERIQHVLSGPRVESRLSPVPSHPAGPCPGPVDPIPQTSGSI